MIRRLSKGEREQRLEGDLVVARLSSGIPVVGKVEVWDNFARSNNGGSDV